VEPAWLDALLLPLAEGPGLATAKLLLMDQPDRIDACGNVVHLSGITVCRGYGQPAFSFPERELILAVSGAAFAIDRALFDRLGEFDEGFFLYLEDTDLSLRAALAGSPVWYVPGSRVRHRHRPGFTPDKLYWLERNRWRMLLKIWSASTVLGLTPHLLLMELMVWAYAASRGRRALQAKAASYAWLLTHTRTLLRSRSDTQRQRAVSDRDLIAGTAWRMDLAELIASPIVRRAAAVALVPPMWLATIWLHAATSIGDGTGWRTRPPHAPS
jgi:GT2 family glycosyltransferase